MAMRLEAAGSEAALDDGRNRGQAPWPARCQKTPRLSSDFRPRFPAPGFPHNVPRIGNRLNQPERVVRDLADTVRQDPLWKWKKWRKFDAVD